MTELEDILGSEETENDQAKKMNNQMFSMFNQMNRGGQARGVFSTNKNASPNPTQPKQQQQQDSAPHVWGSHWVMSTAEERN